MLATSCITPEYAALRGYQTAYKDQGSRLRELGFSDVAACHVPGLVIPLRDRFKQVWGAQFRPDVPYQFNGKTTKYVVRPGQGNRLDIPPSVADSDWLDDRTVPLFIPEGVRKADAGAINGLCTVGLLSVSSWKNNDKALPDWLDISLKRRQTIIAYDSDVMRKKPVHREMEKFRDYLAYRGAEVFYVHLPDCSDWYEDGSKTGLDDFFYHGYTVEDLWNCVKGEPPPLREEGSQIWVESSWTPVDMATCLTTEPILPELGLREDGEPLLYRTKVHWVYGTYESGKTWLCLHLAAQVLQDGGTALYIDFEDDGRGIGSRLLQLGVGQSVLNDPARFVYIRPDETLRTDAGREAFGQTLSRSFDIAVLDGVTESMALESLKDVVGGDVATWQAMLPKSIAKHTGAAVLCIDHVPKDQNNRVMPTGSQHKMSGLDGAAFKVLRDQPFGKGNVGKAFVRVGKDRAGGVRALGVDYDPRDNTHLVGDFVHDAADSFYITACVQVPTADSHVKRSDPGRPTWCMERLSLYLEEGQLEDSERSQTKVVKYAWDNIKGTSGKTISRNTWRAALDTLCAEDHADLQPGSQNSNLCYSARPYRQATDPKSDYYVGTEPLQPRRALEAVADSETAKERRELQGKDSDKRKSLLKHKQALTALASADRELAELDTEVDKCPD